MSLKGNHKASFKLPARRKKSIDESHHDSSFKMSLKGTHIASFKLPSQRRRSSEEKQDSSFQLVSSKLHMEDDSKHSDSIDFGSSDEAPVRKHTFSQHAFNHKKSFKLPARRKKSKEDDTHDSSFNLRLTARRKKSIDDSHDSSFSLSFKVTHKKSFKLPARRRNRREDENDSSFKQLARSTLCIDDYPQDCKESD
jgi:hypothetical protein